MHSKHCWQLSFNRLFCTDFSLNIWKWYPPFYPFRNLLFKLNILLILWEIYPVCFDHIHPPSSILFQIHPLLFCSKANLYFLNILGYITFHWSMVSLSGATLLEKTYSSFYQITIGNSSLTRGGTLCPTFLSMLQFGLAWTHIGLMHSITTVSSVQLFLYLKMILSS